MYSFKNLRSVNDKTLPITAQLLHEDGKRRQKCLCNHIIESLHEEIKYWCDLIY
jgi:hypothetical protein